MDLQKIRSLHNKSFNELTDDETELFFELQNKNNPNVKVSFTTDAPQNQLMLLRIN